MKKLLTIQETADYLNVSRSTLYRWRNNGKGPVFIDVGDIIRYAEDDLDVWVDRKRRWIRL